MKRVLPRFRSSIDGKACAAKDFLDFGSRGAVDLALIRLHRKGKIVRLKWNIGPNSDDPAAVRIDDKQS